MKILKIIGILIFGSLAFVGITQRNVPGGENNIYAGIICLILTFLLLSSLVRNKSTDSTKSNNSTQKQNALANKKALEEQLRELIDSNQIEPIVPRSVVPKKDELVYLEQSAVLKTVQNKLLGTTGSSGGVSVRVTKGMYLRTGSSGSKKIYGDVISEYPGTLAISNQRIVFSNPKKGFEIPLSKLSSIESDFDTIIFQQGNKTFYVESDHSDMIEYFIRHIVTQNN